MRAASDNVAVGFAKRLAGYKRAIDLDLAAYAKHAAASTAQQYGPYGALTTGAFLEMLQRGGKRIRGALTMVGYEMCGGRDQAMITRAASAVEMMHAYILIIDDIQDRSRLRRGKPTAHVQLATYHKRHHLRGDTDHTGVSLALNAALAGAHAAQVLLAGLEVDPQLRLNAIGIINHTMIVTSHGQTYDILNELTATTELRDIERALEWKTAHYTFLNPLCMGMTLAGAGCEKTDAIRAYALHAGMAFQIADDIIGMYGTEAQSGKSPMDDIREGKRTLLTAFALAHAVPADRTFLLDCLGNADLRLADFVRCQKIITDCGALAAARRSADSHIAAALASLEASAHYYSAAGVAFLQDLAAAVPRRDA